MRKLYSIKVLIIGLLFNISLNSCQKNTDKEIINEQQIFTSAQPTDISFANENIGFISGSFEEEFGTAVIAKSLDGGESWQVIPVFLNSGPTSLIRSIYAVSQDSIYATFSSVISQGICFSNDGGTTWIDLVSFPILVGYTNIIFTHPQTGFVCGGGSIYKTKNNWENWAKVYDHSEVGGVGKLEFTDNNTGYGYGSLVYDNVINGYLFKTTDEGENWTELTTLNKSITCLKFVNNSIGYAFTFQNDIYKTSNGGINWSLLNNFSNSGESYYAAIIDSRYKYFASGPSIFKTKDDFKTYAKVFTSTNLNTFLSVKAVHPSEDVIFFISSEHSVIKIQFSTN